MSMSMSIPARTVNNELDLTGSVAWVEVELGPARYSALLFMEVCSRRKVCKPCDQNPRRTRPSLLFTHQAFLGSCLV